MTAHTRQESKKRFVTHNAGAAEQYTEDTQMHPKVLAAQIENERGTRDKKQRLQAIAASEIQVYNRRSEA